MITFDYPVLSLSFWHVKCSSGYIYICRIVDHAMNPITLQRWCKLLFFSSSPSLPFPLQMTLKNLRIVFGPTLVRTPSDDFSTINDGYTVIELLCKHVSWWKVYIYGIESKVVNFMYHLLTTHHKKYKHKLTNALTYAHSCRWRSSLVLSCVQRNRNGQRGWRRKRRRRL